jgi:tetratricopeptide (TPR) repeat protein
MERTARQALPVLEAVGDDEGIAFVWHVLGWVANTYSRLDDWARAVEQALLHSRPAEGAVHRAFLGVALTFGPRPAEDALAKLDALASEEPHPGELGTRAVLLAMLDRIDEAQALVLPPTERGRESGFSESALASIALITGDWEAAASYLRSQCERLETSGQLGLLSTTAPRFGIVLYELGRYDEAEERAQQGRELGDLDPDDVLTQEEWRRAQALVHSARGEHAEAERLAREALGFGLQTDSPLWQGDAYRDLATVLEAAGKRDEAVAALEQALECYESKPIIPLARRVRERLASLQPV